MKKQYLNILDVLLTGFWIDNIPIIPAAVIIRRVGTHIKENVSVDLPLPINPKTTPHNPP